MNRHQADGRGDPAREARRRFGWILPAAFVALAYGLTYAWLPARGFWINDNGCKFIQMEGIIRSNYHSFSIPWPGQALDPDFQFNPLAPPFGHVVDGRLYAQYSPVFALVESVPYRWLGVHGLYVLPLLGGLVTIPAVWRLARQISRSALAPPLAVIVSALATPLWFYSMNFWELMPAVALSTWGLACTLRGAGRARYGLIALGGALCGLGVYFRDELYLFGAVVTLLLLLRGPDRRRVVPLFAAVFLLGLVPLWLFQWQALGHPLGYHFSANAPLEYGVAQYAAERWLVLRRLFLNFHPRLAFSLPIGIPALALFLLFPRLRPSWFVRGLPLLACGAVGAGAVVVAGRLGTTDPVMWLMFSNSLFAASPLLVLALVRSRRVAAEGGAVEPPAAPERGRTTLWLIALLYALGYALVVPEINAQGIHWGCRFLLPLYPLLSALAAATIGQWWEAARGRWRWGGAVVGAALALSIALQVYSLHLLHARKEFSAKLNRVVAARPEQAIIATGWFVPQELYDCFYQRPIFLARTQEDFQLLWATLRRAGYEQVLHVASPPGRSRGMGDRQILSDGLNFMTVELRGLLLAP